MTSLINKISTVDISKIEKKWKYRRKKEPGISGSDFIKNKETTRKGNISKCE